MGARPLYYSFNTSRIIWSTVLDPLLLLAENAPRLSEEYIASWISSFPDSSLSPFVNIHSVPPSSVVRIRRGSVQISKYWDFDPQKIIRYRHDAEYEEHFRTVFSEAVRRRLRSKNPILAELSGGMDSSSIVCMADTLFERNVAETPRMDTLSYFDDSEPNWNERIYFEKVEEKRGRAGYRIDVSGARYFEINQDCASFPSTPAAAGHSRPINSELLDRLNSQCTRVLLSGIGGDEILGGVPTPIPELADLIASGSFLTLGHQLKEWALNKRKPLLHLLFQTIDRFLPRVLASAPTLHWFHADFAHRNLMTLVPRFHRISPLGPRPSLQINLHSLDGLRNQLACLSSPTAPIFETRYPFLDRSLLEFIYAIPREQLVRPGQRRSLMRRALVGIVPDEILNRRRKAFLRGPLRAATTDWPRLLRNSGTLLIEVLGVVNTNNLISTLENERGRSNIPIVPLMRVLTLERWLRSLSHRNLLPIPPASDPSLNWGGGIPRAHLLSAENNANSERR